MSDNLPFEIQIEIINRLPVKSLIQFRSVSKTWKSLIDSSDFIAHYSSRQHTQMQHLLVRCFYPDVFDHKYVLYADDDTFPQHKTCLTFPRLLNRLDNYRIIDCSHGLLCLYGYYIKGLVVNKSLTSMVVFWNLSIRKAVAVIVPSLTDYETFITVVGFGVCEATTDPKVVKISPHRSDDMFRTVEVFTLSTGAWRSSFNNLPRKSIKFDNKQVVVDGLLYWLATDTSTMDVGYNLIVSFDLTSEEFREVNLPSNCLSQGSYKLRLSKLRNSLVLLEDDVDNNNNINSVFVVWMMEDGVTKSFTKLFTINVNPPDVLVIGFNKNGAPIVEISEYGRGELVVYEPYSKNMDNFCVYGRVSSFAVDPYVETLLLLDQPDHMIYNDI